MNANTNTDSRRRGRRNNHLQNFKRFLFSLATFNKLPKTSVILVGNMACKTKKHICYFIIHGPQTLSPSASQKFPQIQKIGIYKLQQTTSICILFRVDTYNAVVSTQDILVEPQGMHRQSAWHKMKEGISILSQGRILSILWHTRKWRKTRWWKPLCCTHSW